MTSPPRWVGVVLRVIVATLAISVVLLPWMRGVFDPPPLRWLDVVLGWQCHRFPSRTWGAGGVSMAVCSRCAGVYAGVIPGVLAAWPRWSARGTALWVTCAVLALVMAVIAEAYGVIGTSHGLRAVTGIALSWPVAALAARWATYGRRVLGGRAR